jgi:hypothetical protein
MYQRLKPGYFLIATVLLQVASWIAESLFVGWLASFALFAYVALAVFGKFVAPHLEPTPFTHFSERFWPSFTELSVTIPKVIMIVMLVLLLIAVLVTLALKA